MNKNNKQTIKLYYDGDCVFCKRYAKFVNLRKKYDIQLINARDTKEDIQELYRKGYDINSGMILVHGPNIYQGSDAWEKIDDLIEDKGMREQLHHRATKYPGLRTILYRIAFFLRKLVLVGQQKTKKGNFRI